MNYLFEDFIRDGPKIIYGAFTDDFRERQRFMYLLFENHSLEYEFRGVSCKTLLISGRIISIEKEKKTSPSVMRCSWTSLNEL